ncbi:MAG TPA: hypothetical protein PK395_18760 [bacterium]|nr:hypothetical protein [bacterium]HQQ00798.1 hypothetical protein [bacterium]
MLSNLFAFGKAILEWIRDPRRQRRSVLNQIEHDRKEILNKVDNLTSTDKSDRDKARASLLKEIRK